MFKARRIKIKIVICKIFFNNVPRFNCSMKKLFLNFALLSFCFPFCEMAIADDYKYFKTSTSIINNVPTVKLYGVKTFGDETLVDTFESSRSGITSFNSTFEDAIVDQYEGKIYFEINENDGTNNYEGVLEYDLVNNTLTKVQTTGNIDLSNYELYPERIKQMIRRNKLTGVTSIGENSLKLKETSTTQQLWGTNAEGKIVPIDITNGSKLLINGRDVEQSINNVGALSAALTGLPTVPKDTTLACGLGAGTHGGDFAFSGGCASKINKKLSINYAASMTMPGQDYAGDFEDTFSARAGFIWKLGKTNKPTQISMKAKEKMEAKILSLEENNNKIISQNKDLKQQNKSIISKNQNLENTVSTLMARLERLEKIASRDIKSQDLASIKD